MGATSLDFEYIADRVRRVRENVNQALVRSGRDGAAVDVIAVTKSAPPEVLPALFEAGITDAAENRWQVARDKLAHPAAERFKWHFIGSLQTNKVKYIVPRFDWIHSVDRLELAEALSREAAKTGRTLNILLQVNIAREPQKQGFHQEDVRRVVELVAQLPHLELRGLMTMAPKVAHSEESRPIFRALDELSRQVREDMQLPAFDQLSMGMSDDYPVAVEEGATMIRVGRQLVGPADLTQGGQGL